METLKELHTRLLASAIHGDAPLPSDEGQLDCLLHPEKYAAVLPGGEPCTCGKDAPCIKSCHFFSSDQRRNRQKYTSTKTNAAAAPPVLTSAISWSQAAIRSPCSMP